MIFNEVEDTGEPQENTSIIGGTPLNDVLKYCKKKKCNYWGYIHSSLIEYNELNFGYGGGDMILAFDNNNRLVALD